MHHAFATALTLVLTASAIPAGAAGDPAQGEQIYKRCQGCHSIAANRVGPRHEGLFGRKAGGLSDYSYSTAMKSADIIWDETTLDQFLADPRGFVRGTKMPFAGIADAEERADLIAFLKSATAKPAE